MEFLTCWLKDFLITSFEATSPSVIVLKSSKGQKIQPLWSKHHCLCQTCLPSTSSLFLFSKCHRKLPEMLFQNVASLYWVMKYRKNLQQHWYLQLGNCIMCQLLLCLSLNSLCCTVVQRLLHKSHLIAIFLP